MDLFELGRKYDCLKTKDRFKYSWAFCKEIYPAHFHEKRQYVKSVLEIGVHEGGSLRMWAEYFPFAMIYGIDIKDSFKDIGHIKFRQGSQDDAEFLNKVSDEVGSWDIVIDDGNHKFNSQKLSFETLWPRLRSGGTYVIEDVGYRHPKSVALFGYFAEVMKEKLGKLTRDEETNTYTDIKSISFYPKLIVVEKV